MCNFDKNDGGQVGKHLGFRESLSINEDEKEDDGVASHLKVWKIIVPKQVTRVRLFLVYV